MSRPVKLVKEIQVGSIIYSGDWDPVRFWIVLSVVVWGDMVKVVYLYVDGDHRTKVLEEYGIHDTYSYNILHHNLLLFPLTSCVDEQSVCSYGCMSVNTSQRSL